MEVERVQDGPLKTTEISRFLEASKTSYKTVNNILTDKKESRFQQKTLIEIASETEIRNNAAKIDLTNEPIPAMPEEHQTSEEIKEIELNEQKRKDEEKESLRLSEEKEKEDARLIQEEKEKEIYQRGFVEGKEAADIEAKKNLNSGLLALENARKSILDLNASHFINLREQIAAQILSLSSERVGLAIKDLPEEFFSKIEALIETIGQTTQSPIVYLNPDDLKSIQDSISAQEENVGFNFRSQDDLMNGDIIIEIGSISIKDLAKERSGISDTPKSLDLVKEATDKKLKENKLDTLQNQNDTGSEDKGNQS